jgi:uncharacterized protein YdhG (YjbR/CyaY superfamily)
MPVKKAAGRKQVRYREDRTGRVYKTTVTKSGPRAKTRAPGSVVDRYLASLSEDKRAALEKLRKTILAAAPRAEECLSYRLPAFRLDGKVLVLFGATAGHCALYPGSGTAVEAHTDELEGFRTSKGTIRFQPDEPLPASLVRKLVRYRIAENAAERHAAGGPARRR